MSAPTIQPSDPAGGASLAPDAGFAGENSTINPTEARVQQQAAAAVAAQQASAAYAKRERDVREYTDALVEYHDLPDEFRSTEAPEMTMVNRRGSEISSLRSPKGADLAANARDAETQRFADWERDQLFEGDKLHRARDYLYYQRERANAGVTSYFSGERTGNYERDLVDVQQAYNAARNEGRDFVWEGKIADTEDLAHAFSLGMINLGANESRKEAMYKAYVQDPLKIGRAGVLADPNSAESKELLEAEYQDYLEFRNTPLTFENKVYMPRVAPERVAMDAAKNAARVEYNAAQSEYVANLHNFMVNTGYKSFEDLGTDIAEFKTRQASQPTFTDQVRAAERADWIAYQNLPASQQTNPVLRDYAAAAEREVEHNLLGQPVGISLPVTENSLNLTTGIFRGQIESGLRNPSSSDAGVMIDFNEPVFLVPEQKQYLNINNTSQKDNTNVTPPAPVRPDGGFTAQNAIVALTGVGGILANIGKSALTSFGGTAGSSALKSIGGVLAVLVQDMWRDHRLITH